MTIGDSNIKSFHPTEAVSLLIIRDEKGFRLFNLIIDNVESINADLDSESMINKKLVEPAQYTAQREHFYMDEHYVQMANYSLRNRLVNRIKNMIPTFVKDSIKYR